WDVEVYEDTRLLLSSRVAVDRTERSRLSVVTGPAAAPVSQPAVTSAEARPLTAIVPEARIAPAEPLAPSPPTQSVRFAVGDDTPDGVALGPLDRLATRLNDNPETRLKIVG